MVMSMLCLYLTLAPLYKILSKQVVKGGEEEFSGQSTGLALGKSGSFPSSTPDTSWYLGLSHIGKHKKSYL